MDSGSCLEPVVVNMRFTAYDVYIGRRGKGHDGYFGNPIRKGIECSLCGEVHRTRSSTLVCYEDYLRARLMVDTLFRERVKALRGKRLGCFCKPRACHGDILARYAMSIWVEG